jgi:hypothetical protein
MNICESKFEGSVQIWSIDQSNDSQTAVFYWSFFKNLQSFPIKMTSREPIDYARLSANSEKEKSHQIVSKKSFNHLTSVATEDVVSIQTCNHFRVEGGRKSFKGIAKGSVFALNPHMA